MQLSLLNEQISDYQNYLEEAQQFYNEVLWDVQINFSSNWDVEAPDFGEMYSKAINSNVSRRLWKMKNGDAKARMMAFIEIDQEFVRTLFKGLFNEEKDLGYRVSHFQFGCQVLMDEFRKLHPKSIETDHHHLNNHMCSLYLSLNQPKVYPVFYSNLFISFMGKIGVQDLPVDNDYERFSKVSQTLYKLISKKEDFIEKSLTCLPEQYHDLGFCQFVITDFYRWVAKRKKR